MAAILSVFFRTVIFALICILLLPLVSYGLPNLIPIRSVGWADAIHVSTVTGTLSDSFPLTTAHVLYVDYSVGNNGTTSVGAYVIHLYLDAQLIRSVTTIPPTDPGVSDTVIDYSIGTLSAGTHTLRVVADPNNAIAESNEGDNEYTKTFTVTSSTLNLSNLRPYTPSGWSASIVVSTSPGTNTDSPSLSPTNTLYVDWAVINSGTVATATGFQTALYLDGQLLQTWNPAALASNTYTSISDFAVGPLSAGTHTLRLVADSTNAIAESDESDNQYTKTFIVTQSPSPDLTVTSVTGPGTASSGGQISVSAQISNQGGVNAGSFRLGFYLSTDSIITTSDVFIGSCAYNSGLAAGASNTCSVQVTLPPTLVPRTYSLGAIADDQNSVVESNESNNSLAGNSIAVTGSVFTLFVPIVLSAAGLNNSFFTSELTLTNRGASSVTLTFNYTAAFGSGNGTASTLLPAGRQQIFPDAIAYLRALGINIPSLGSNGGTLRIQVSGAASDSAVGVNVRTTTGVPGGRAGLAYPGLPSSLLLTGPAYLCGLRQNLADRSNVAIQNAGDPLQGSITLRLSVYDGRSSLVSLLPLETLAPGEFRQISGILVSNGLSIRNGYVRVDRISGTAPYFAYGVINDQANSDGSFVPPISESSLAGNRGLTLPVVVETSSFSTEVVLTNWSTQNRTVSFQYRSDAIPTASHDVFFQIQINAGAQAIYPDFVQFLRTLGIAGLGPRGPAFVGALYAGAASSGEMSGLGLAARTATPGGGGKYGLYYTSVPYNSSSTSSAWVYGLQQNAENRSNLALVNTGVGDRSTNVFDIEIIDGDTGLRVNTIRGVSVQVDAWLQLNGILADYAPGTQQGYARVTRTSGPPFVVYAVINDGAQAGLRSGDGAFVTSQP